MQGSVACGKREIVARRREPRRRSFLIAQPIIMKRRKEERKLGAKSWLRQDAGGFLEKSELRQVQARRDQIANRINVRAPRKNPGGDGANARRVEQIGKRDAGLPAAGSQGMERWL